MSIDTDGDYTSDDYCNFPSPSEHRRSTPRALAKKVRKASHRTQESKPPLRPAKDILSRIRHDPALKESDFIIGYHDRHAPEIMEIEVSLWKGGGDFTDEEWIPQHRIVYFRRKGKGNEVGEKMWDREKRLDRLFGSGVLPDAAMLDSSESVEKWVEGRQTAYKDQGSGDERAGEQTTVSASRSIA